MIRLNREKPLRTHRKARLKADLSKLARYSSFKEAGSRELRERRERAHQQIFYAPVRVVRVIRGYLFLEKGTPASEAL